MTQLAVSPVDAGKGPERTRVVKSIAQDPSALEDFISIEAAGGHPRPASAVKGGGVEPAGRALKVLREFEGYILQTFLSSMLPSDSDNVFGKGAAGDAWKSMLAETISKEMTAAGGIGIASVMLRALGNSTEKLD